MLVSPLKNVGKLSKTTTLSPQLGIFQKLIHTIPDIPPEKPSTYPKTNQPKSTAGKGVLDLSTPSTGLIVVIVNKLIK